MYLGMLVSFITAEVYQPSEISACILSLLYSNQMTPSYLQIMSHFISLDRDVSVGS